MTFFFLIYIFYFENNTKVLIFFFFIIYLLPCQCWARCNEERWMPNRGTGSHGCNLLLALELSWLCYVILSVKCDSFVVYNRMFHLGLKMCVCKRLCLFVSSFLKWELQCYGRDEHTHRNASVQPYLIG